MLEFRQVNIENITSLRELYFVSIQLSQELFLEWKVENGSYFTINNNSELIGYFIISADNILLEHYIIDEAAINKNDILLSIINKYGIKKIYCKSFDNHLLLPCNALCSSSKIIGRLYRDYFSSDPIFSSNTYRIAFANISDFELLVKQEGELYENEEELLKMLNGNCVMMFFIDGILVGCGFLIQIIKHKQYYDIGMWVHPDYRKQGHAAYIIHYLKSYCLANGFIPICGCAIDNIGSQKTLEKNGFIGKHYLYEFIV